MFPDFQFGHCEYGSVGITIDGSNTLPTIITSHATPNTDDVYTTLGTAPFDVHAIRPFLLQNSGASASNSNGLVDIARGASTEEDDIFKSLKAGWHDKRYGPQAACIWWPTHIKSGERISARFRCEDASIPLGIMLQLRGASGFHEGLAIRGNIAAYGVVRDGSTSSGTVIASGNGSYVVNLIDADIDEEIKYMVIALDFKDNTSQGDRQYAMRVMRGASGQEETFTDNFYHMQESSGDQMGPLQMGPIPVSIPLGERLSVESRSGGSTQDYALIIYGIS